MLLEGKVAVVTGSSRGLGRAYALALASEGAKVVVNGTQAEGIAQVVREIRDKGGLAEGCAATVATMDGARRTVQTAIEGFGRIDILVNNAGFVRDRTLLNMAEEELDSVVAVHVKGTYGCTRVAAEHMRKQGGGRIINVVSRAMQGRFGQSNYGAAKGGIMAMTLSWALELGRYNITVNAVRTTALTDMTRPLMERRLREAQEKGLPSPPLSGPGMGLPEELAPLIAYLASEEAGYINGQLLGTDGRTISIYAPPREVAYAIRDLPWSLELLRADFKRVLGPHLIPQGPGGTGG